ncbi:hypothetical protein MMC30_006561 [Trapelia coarctata]|nr:hypothetical protein [Trapelia coarctata]
MLGSDLNVDSSKLQPSAIDPAQIEFNKYLISVLEGGPQWYEVGAEQYRALRREGKTHFPKPIVLDAGKSFSIPSREKGRDIPCRLMMPEGGKPVGVYMFIHGGGWVLVSENDGDPLLKFIADAANLAVISIGYRLAPEHPFPQGPEDCFDAAMWLVDHAEAELGAPLKFIGGESAGGHLTVLTTFHLLETRPQFHLAGLVLNFGAYDLTLLPMAKNFDQPLVLTPKIMDYFLEAFLPGIPMEQRKDPSISPFYKDLRGLKLPSALFSCGTADCLLDDTVMMAVKWQMAGGEAITRLFPGAPHGFIAFPPDKLAAANEWRELAGEYLRAKLKA